MTEFGPHLLAQNDKLRGRAAYFVRISQKAVTDKTVEQDIAAGQISGTALDAFRTLLTDLFVPVLKEQGNWGKSADEYVSEFMQVSQASRRGLCAPGCIHCVLCDAFELWSTAQRCVRRFTRSASKETRQTLS